MIRYELNKLIDAEIFIDLLKRSTLGERRPIEDHKCMEGMVANSNLLLTAWDDDLLVGVARSMTDFHYACYLSDLAVDRAYQRQGIGKELIKRTRNELQSTCKLILIAAPDANEYYKALGFENNLRCWVKL